ncbi:MAG TPA: FtsX-like permease family protein, partial [Kofleriaceae bacterium]|nr:FtsX-like permease family protein [Kofleriaceae bacterium]
MTVRPRASKLDVMHARLLVWSLRQRRGRHVLNLIATAVTVAVVIVFLSVLLQLLELAHVRTGGELSRILVAPRIVRPGTGTDGMPLTLGPRIAQIDGVEVVQHKLVITGRHESGATYMISGEDDTGVELNKDIYPVDQATFEAWKKEPLGAIVTDATANDLRLALGQTTEVTTATGRLQIKVVGIAKGSAFTHLIGVHFPYMQQFTKNSDTCGYRVFTTPSKLDSVITEITALTKNSPMPAQGISSTRFRADTARRASTIPVVLGFLGLFLVFTTALTLANNSAISIRERRVEVATLRVIGYHSGAILRLLVSEAVVVGVLGGLLAAAAIVIGFRNGVQVAPPQ